jgi:hypothetical protein
MASWSGVSSTSPASPYARRRAERGDVVTECARVILCDPKTAESISDVHSAGMTAKVAAEVTA